MANIDTTKVVTIPTNNTTNSNEENTKPILISLRALAPSIIGIARKKENSEAINLEVPKNIAPNIVAPEREVPGINAKT